MKDLRLSLKREWFEMTASGVKTEDYREITPYWIKRLTTNNIELSLDNILNALYDLRIGFTEQEVVNIHGLYLKKFTSNTTTLGYPKKTDTDRIKTYIHKGIEIREGNTEWGAEYGVIYFVIKHGEEI